MQNGNRKNDVYESDITEKIYEKDKYGEIEGLKKIRDEFKKVSNREASCFFLKAVDMYKLSNIPDFIGLNIAIGYDEEKKADVLIVVPVIKGRVIKETQQTNTGQSEMRGGAQSVMGQSNTDEPETEEGPENVTTQEYIVNGEPRTTSTVAILAKGPCPPPPVGCSNCSCTGR